MRKLTVLLGIVSALLLVTGAFAEQTDNPKCKDHQWFSKMPGTTAVQDNSSGGW